MRIERRLYRIFSCEEGISGEALASLILDTIRRYGLDADFLRGQGYDGAGNMAGNLRGVKARIQAEFPKAVYVHCASHKRNLVIVEACKIPVVRNAMGVITKVADFLKYSPKRQAFLEKKFVSKARIRPQRERNF